MPSTSGEPSIEVVLAPAIPGLTFRRLRDERDYAAIAALEGATSLADGTDYVPSAENVQLEFENEADADPRTDLILAEIDGRLVATTNVMRQVRDDVPVYFSFCTVHPEHRGRGIGHALLGASERRLREIARGFDDQGRGVFGAWADERQGGAWDLLDSEGYRPVRYAFTMRRASLVDLPVAPLPGGLEVRAVRPEHHRAIFDANNEAFRDHWGHREQTEEDFVLTFETPDLDTSLWRVAWDGEQIAGVVMTYVWASENETLGVRRGWLERISVRRPWRRRGLGSALTVSALQGLRDAGMTEAMLGVDAENPTGALRLYESLGFEVTSRGAQYRKPM